MTKVEDLNISVTFYDRLTGEDIMEASTPLSTLDDDTVQETAADLAFALIEDMWAEIEEGDE